MPFLIIFISFNEASCAQFYPLTQLLGLYETVRNKEEVTDVTIHILRFVIFN